MERILTKSRMMEYLTVDGLSKMTGVPSDKFDIYVTIIAAYFNKYVTRMKVAMSECCKRCFV